MQTKKSLHNLYTDSETRYKNKHLEFNKTELHQKIDNLVKLSETKYLTFSEPKICSQKVYTNIWINETISEDIATKEVGKPVRMNSPPSEYKASVDLLNNFPQEYIKEVKKKYSDKLDQFDYSLIKEKWLAAIIERNNFSLGKGYVSRLNMHLDHFAIPKSEYETFLNNIDSVINYCNQHVSLDPSKLSEWESSKICFICNVETFPLKNTQELFDLYKNKYPILKKYQDKIKIRLDNKSNARYIKENDIFDITLNKNLSINHQIVDLIHELAHAVSMLKIYKKNEFLSFLGTYYWEKLAIDVELDFMNKNFPILLSANLGHILQIFHQTLFEIEIYQHPNQDPDKLYAKCFNRCFKGANQEINRSYLVNLDILYNNFRLLPYAVAYSNILNATLAK